VRTKVWVEREDGVVLMSEFRAALLEGVAAEGSMAAAARAIGLPNRTAWKKLEEMERAAGVALVDASSGGASGGGATLTEAGRALLDAYRRVSGPVAEEVDQRFEEERAVFEAETR
jgi:molybdate transport system regulatory protein